MANETAHGRWDELDAARQGLLRRCEKYAMFTVPKICPPNGYDQNNNELQHDYQSVGAQAVNHLSNKLMLAQFAPSRPFFRLDPSKELQRQLDAAEVAKEDVSAALSQAEATATRLLDQRSVRPKMYDAMKHIIITGNGLGIFQKESIRVLGIKNFVVKRGVDGLVLEIIVKEHVNCLSLDPKIIEELGAKLDADCEEVDIYYWVRKRKQDTDYEMDTWVNENKLSAAFSGKWPAQSCPYKVFTWDLASGDDYGTGLVEDYAGDFAALSIMSKATVQAAVLASEFRWLANPAGLTSPEDLQNSNNGDVLPGVEGDLTLVQSGKGADLAVNIQIAQGYIQRIGQGFLLSSAVTRQAERVTAEEIRMTAEELENSLGGAYSRIAVDMQIPMAYWLMESSGQKIGGKQLIPTIITGLAALSRSGDRDNLMLFLQDASAIGTLPPALQARLKITPIYSALAAARGLSPTAYLLSEAEFQQAQQQQQQQLLQQQAIMNASEAGTAAGIKQAQPQGTQQ